MAAGVQGEAACPLRSAANLARVVRRDRAESRAVGHQLVGRVVCVDTHLVLGKRPFLTPVPTDYAKAAR